jgi:phenylacetate-CoA ligase
MQFQMERTQRLPVQQIRARQLQQLEFLCRYASQQVPFYQTRFQNHKMLSKPLSWETWRSLPCLTRDDIQKEGAALLTQKLPPRHGSPFKVSTSGSTGKPVTVWHNDLTTFFWRAFTLREHFWHQRKFSGKLAAIRFVETEEAKFPDGLKLNGWGASTDIVLKTGPASILTIQTPIDQQADWLLRENPEYLLTNPTNALALAQYFRDSGRKLDHLLEVRTMSETLSPETVQTCKEVWGVEVTDIYSTREVGYIALQCPEHRRYHEQSENILVEILRDDGTPCEPGEIGKVVITSLINYASPIIRYDIGDYAERGPQCSCGRGLPVIEKIMGRVRNILRLPNGQSNWPVFNYKELEKTVPYRQIQVIQHSLTQLEVRLVVDEPANKVQEERMQAIIRQAVNSPFDVTFSYLQQIPRTKGGKYEEFISHVQ